jgi:plastocyanin
MQRGRTRLAYVLAFAVALVVAAGCSSGDSGGSASGGGGGGGGGGGEKLSLEAQGIKFSTTDLQLKTGQAYTVTFTNKDSVEHNFTFKEANAEKDVEGGESGEVTFTAPAAGSYKFFCKYHPSQMTGTVTVS